MRIARASSCSWNIVEEELRTFKARPSRHKLVDTDGPGVAWRHLQIKLFRYTIYPPQPQKPWQTNATRSNSILTRFSATQSEHQSRSYIKPEPRDVRRRNLNLICIRFSIFSRAWKIGAELNSNTLMTQIQFRVRPFLFYERTCGYKYVMRIGVRPDLITRMNYSAGNPGLHRTWLR